MKGINLDQNKARIKTTLGLISKNINDLPSADSFKRGFCQLQAKVCARITG